MKICHISTVHQTFDVRVFHKQCVSLAKYGHEVSLIVQGESQIKDGVSIVGLRKPKGRMDRMLRLSREAYQKAIEIDAEVYQIHDPELLPIAKRLKKKGKKVIYDSHEIYSIQIAEKPYLPKWSRSIVRRLYTGFETGIIRNLDAVFVPCTVDGKNVFEGRAKRVLLVPNYPMLSEIGEPGSVKSDAVCFLGKLSRSHGFTEVMEACYKNGVKLIAAGGVEADYLAELQEKAAFACVDYRGYVARDEVKRILSESKIGVATYYLSGQYALP